MGRPKKYPDEIKHQNISMYLPEYFKPIWENIKKLAEIDNDPEFLVYLKEVEKVNDLTWRQKTVLGKRATYLRWLGAKRVLEKTSLLQRYDIIKRQMELDK